MTRSLQIVALEEYIYDRGSGSTVWTMPMPPDPSITEPEFFFLTRRAGLRLSATQLAETYRVYGYIEQMAENVRKPRSIDAEPALIFTTEKK